MKLFDSHCHIDDSAYDEDFDEVLRRAADAGVSAMMIAGIDLEASRKAVAIAESHPNIFASVGFHPHDTASADDAAMRQLCNLAGHVKAKAWGEIGLDFYRMHTPQPVQEQWLIRQIEAADEMDMPIIFHERDSNGRLLSILKTYHRRPGNGVIHCFSGTHAELMQYLKMGYRIGVTGILTLQSRGANLRELVPGIPRNRILIETDAPYLTPAPDKNRFRRNEPAFVRSVLMKLSEVLGENPEALAEMLWRNTCELFRISPESLP